jgi:hypothetical protein
MSDPTHVPVQAESRDDANTAIQLTEEQIALVQEGYDSLATGERIPLDEAAHLVKERTRAWMKANGAESA